MHGPAMPYRQCQTTPARAAIDAQTTCEQQRGAHLAEMILLHSWISLSQQATRRYGRYVAMSSRANCNTPPFPFCRNNGDKAPTHHQVSGHPVLSRMAQQQCFQLRLSLQPVARRGLHKPSRPYVRLVDALKTLEEVSLLTRSILEAKCRAATQSCSTTGKSQANHLCLRDQAMHLNAQLHTCTLSKVPFGNINTDLLLLQLPISSPTRLYERSRSAHTCKTRMQTSAVLCTCGSFVCSYYIVLGRAQGPCHSKQAP
ncbi:hypothetical protein HDV57DRAFT_59116 [Trichoderma longibrachiatum]